MPIFTISITETQNGFVELEAETIESAKEKAEESYHQGNVKWTKSDYQIQEGNI